MNEPPNKTELIAIEVIRAEMRITDARLTDAIEHEMGLRKLHDDAVDRVRRVRALKDDLQKRADSIYRISSEKRLASADENLTDHEK